MKIHEYGSWTEKISLGRPSEWLLGHNSSTDWWGYVYWKNGICHYSEDGYGAWGSYSAEEYGADLEDFLYSGE